MKRSTALGFQLLAGLNPLPLTGGEVGVGVPWESAGGPPSAAFGPRQREAGLWESFIPPPPTGSSALLCQVLTERFLKKGAAVRTAALNGRLIQEGVQTLSSYSPALTPAAC